MVDLNTIIESANTLSPGIFGILNVLKTAGIIFIVYIIFLIYRGILAIADRRRLKRIEEKVDLLLAHKTHKK